jgi:hypothetical protein
MRSKAALAAAKESGTRLGRRAHARDPQGTGQRSSLPTCCRSFETSRRLAIRASTPSPGSSTALNPLLLNGVSCSAGCRSLLVREPLGTLSALC